MNRYEHQKTPSGLTSIGSADWRQFGHSGSGRLGLERKKCSKSAEILFLAWQGRREVLDAEWETGSEERVAELLVSNPVQGAEADFHFADGEQGCIGAFCGGRLSGPSGFGGGGDFAEAQTGGAGGC